MSRDSAPRILVVLNVALSVAALVLALRMRQPAPAVEVAPIKVATAKSVATVPAVAHFPTAATPADQRRWLIDQLRAMGVPNKVLAQIVLKDLDQRWNKYATEVTLQTRGNAEVLTKLNLQIEKQRDADMRAALGEEGFKEWDTDNMRREVNSGGIKLSGPETDTAYALWKKLRQRDLELREQKFEGKIDEAGVGEAYAKDAQAFQQQLKTLLGDERFAQAQAGGPRAAAADLRQDFAKVNATEAQFQELLQTQQQWNALRADLAKNPGDDATYVQSLKDLDEARDQEYRRVLGADAFDAYKKQQDPTYSEMKKYQQIWGLDDSKIDHVYGAMRYFQQNAEDYQSSARALAAKGQQVDWDAVTKNLQQFAQQTRQSLQNYLGPDSFEKLQRNGLLQFNQPAGDLPNSPGGRPF